MEQKWMDLAKSYIGTKEGVDEKNNPIIVNFYKLAGHSGIKQDSVPWCAAFVGAVLTLCGIRGTRTLRALDYKNWGQEIKEPVVGAIATKKRDGGGHVFFVSSFDCDYVYGLGGNQSDSVNITKFKRSEIYSYSYPPNRVIPKKKLIKIGGC
jgi:uncharacterized protein (TIGR02594 family)